MHAGSIHTIFRLRHKRSMETMTFGNGLHYQLKGHNVVCCCQCIRILKINLMLCRRILMMRSLHCKSHVLQREDHVSSCIFTKIQRAHIKIACLLVGDRCRHSVIVHMIQEEFAFRSYIERVSHGFRLAYDLLQHITGISLITASIRAVHITDQTRHLALLGSPRKCSKSAVIRVQIHITLFHPHKPFH